MRVPRRACLVVDYNTGLSVPPGRWPRLRAGVSREGDPLPWDILQALALIDGLAGDGDAFWEEYTDALLPAPEALCLPSCWEPHRLEQLQHPAIADAARAQQERLKGLFPDLMEPLAPDTPSWLQWAFASVRSRAFRAGPDAFAFVPFLDLANHADQTSPASPAPNADFRVAGQPEAQDGTAGASYASSCFELVAVRPLAAGEEVTISYCGAEGYTNQRWMAQYGFVPRDGNLADRVSLELTQELQAAPLDLSRLQDLLGDQLFVAALRGTDPYLYAAIKSVPLVDSTEAGAGAVGGRGADVRTAEALLAQVEQQVAQGSTPLEQDEALLHGQAGAELLAADPRQHAAVAYRVERKRLLAKTAALLRAYARGAKAG